MSEEKQKQQAPRRPGHGQGMALEQKVKSLKISGEMTTIWLHVSV